MNALESLYDSLSFLAGLREADDMKVYSRLLEKTASALGADAGVYYYYEPKLERLSPHHRLGGAPAPAVAVGEGLCGRVAKFREPLLAQDGSALCVPLTDRLDLTGAILVSQRARPFEDADLRLAGAICEQASLTLRRLRLEAMVSRVTAYNASILDNLSGGFLAVDLQGRLMICNPAARRILGIAGEVTDLPVEKALAQTPELAAVLRKTLSTKQVAKRQELAWTREGQDRLLGYSTLLIQDPQGAFTGAGVTFQDLTKLK